MGFEGWEPIRLLLLWAHRPKMLKADDAFTLMLCVFQTTCEESLVLQWRVGEGPRRSSWDFNNFQMEEERRRWRRRRWRRRRWRLKEKRRRISVFWMILLRQETKVKSMDKKEQLEISSLKFQALKVRGQSFIQSWSLVLNSVFFPFNVQVFYTFYIQYSSCLLSFRRILYSCQRLCTAAVNSSATSPLLSSTPAHRRCICLHFEKDLFQF